VLVNGLDGGAGFDLDEMEAAAGTALKHIDAHQYAAELEGRFENGRHTVVGEQSAGMGNGVFGVTMIRLHQYAARITQPGETTDFVAGVENGLGDGIDFRAELALVAVVPKFQVALPA